jgi:hypothetical protein
MSVARHLPAGPAARAWQRLSRVVDTRSCELVLLDRHLDDGCLEGAWAHAARQHPLLAATWERGRWRVDAMAPPLVRVSLDADPDLPGLLPRTWSDGARDGSDLTVFRGPTRDALRVRVPHARTDAASGAQVVQDLADAYAALRGGRDPELRDDAAPWHPDELLPVTWGDRWRAFTRIAADVLGGAGWSEAPPMRAAPARVRVVDLGGDAISGLKARARAEATSVHVLLTLAVARATGARRLMDLVTVRPLALGDVARRADVLVVPWAMRVPDDDGAARVAIRAQVDAIKDGGARAELARLGLYDTLAALVPLRLALAATFHGIVKADVASTNPGPVQVALDAFGDAGIVEFVNFPHPVPPARRILAWTTFRGRLRLVHAWRDGDDALAARVEQRLLGRLGLG